MKRVWISLLICIPVGLTASLMMSACVSLGGADVGAVVFARTEKTNWTTDIFRMNEDGTDQKNISDKNDFDIYVINADGTNFGNMTNTTGADERYPAWLP